MWGRLVITQYRIYKKKIYVQEICRQTSWQHIAAHEKFKTRQRWEERGNGERQRISLASTEEVDCGIDRQLQIFYCEERLDSSQISTTCYFLSELIMLGLGSVSFQKQHPVTWMYSYRESWGSRWGRLIRFLGLGTKRSCMNIKQYSFLFAQSRK